MGELYPVNFYFYKFFTWQSPLVQPGAFYYSRRYYAPSILTFFADYIVGVFGYFHICNSPLAIYFLNAPNNFIITTSALNLLTCPRCFRSVQ